ncbi:winged helix-turn-helix domain-containing protein [Solwaraspora sp. WMMA2056]|uniref:winged helix-turn-helix domain-containing protein n=1 Tax=Solwaraspora sp. WMMA2056 TaxID=3015161 RepID=UPI00259B699B|nr:winged helix-turn-helix domain-containing protein [Solwaraspora sp. WMMA2056]WJK39715.1 winged helix-turn-helix domain-containing protein [Solwaraspora sp. WMMA2056]
MTGGEVPLVVCVSTDPAVRERLVSRVDDLGAVLVVNNLTELRTMLLSTAVADELAVADGPTATVGRSPAGPTRLGDLLIDPVSTEVTWRGEALALTPLERATLLRLASPPLRLWTYRQLFEAVWGGAYLGDRAALHATVKRLRRKLAALPNGPRVRTVRGAGYHLVSG